MKRRGVLGLATAGLRSLGYEVQEIHARRSRWYVHWQSYSR
jgi:hypothetical protein